ncbi:MAG: hypothetical protein ACE5F4_00400 [Candidatus Paceibacteria bacterium]
MREKVIHSIFASFEWRVIAFIITNIFFWVTTGSFWTATGLALILQSILFVAHTLWFFLRHEVGVHWMWKDHKTKQHQRV